MLLLPSPMGALVHVAAFAVLASAADKLSLTSPSFSQVGKADMPYFALGQEVKISWTTPFDETRLVLYQSRSGDITREVLADGNGPDNTTITWSAMPMAGNPARNSDFYFYLANANDATCDGCTFFSKNFTLQSRNAAVSSSAPASTKTTGASAGSTGSSSQPSSSAGSTTSQSSSDGSSSSGDVAIGVGLGVGVPVVIAAILLFMFLARRRQRRQEGEENEKSLGYTDMTPPQTPQTSQDYDRTNRESGALGPWARDPTPTWEQQEAWEQERRRQLQVRNPGSPLKHQVARDAPPTSDSKFDRMSPVPRTSNLSSQPVDFVPYRPWTSGEDGGSTASSRHSWIDQFEFERPGYRDTDELSEVRQSIHDAPRPDMSAYDQSVKSAASIGDASDIPQMPQPVHQPYADDENWPLRS